MTGAQHRISRAIVRCGEEIGVGAGTTVGIVTLLHPEAARKYLTDAEIEVNGTTLTIEKVIERRLRDVTIYKLAIAF